MESKAKMIHEWINKHEMQLKRLDPEMEKVIRNLMKTSFEVGPLTDKTFHDNQYRDVFFSAAEKARHNEAVDAKRHGQTFEGF